MAEGEQGRHPFAFEPLVSDGGALDVVVGVHGRARARGIGVDHGARQLRLGGGKGGRQVAGRIDGAAQHARDGGPAPRAGIPRLQHRIDGIQPGHEHRSARFQHDDGVRIGTGQGGDQRVLVAGQA